MCSIIFIFYMHKSDTYFPHTVCLAAIYFLFNEINAFVTYHIISQLKSVFH